MHDFSAFSAGERAVLQALTERGVRYVVVGLSAAVLQGAIQQRAICDENA